MGNLIKKRDGKIVEQTTDKKYAHLFQPTYKGLEERHLTKYRGK